MSLRSSGGVARAMAVEKRGNPEGEHGAHESIYGVSGRSAADGGARIWCSMSLNQPAPIILRRAST